MKTMMLILTATLLSIFVHADTFGTGANQFAMDFVNIGNAGNAADSSGYGSVAYNYRIGKYEVTIDQFLKARTADIRISNGNEGYWNDGTRTVGINAPAVGVKWTEAAMFANWLTSGDAHSGAYQFDGSGTYLSLDRVVAVSTYGKAYVIPNENEWYKAAYFKPDASGYSLYASGLDTVPVHGTVNGWNYFDLTDGTVNSAPNYTWEVGFGAEEQSDTHDMMGNVAEWNEDLIAPDNLINRRVRGGGYGNSEARLGSLLNDSKEFTEEYTDVGFRVAVIPEPSSVLLLTVGAGGILFHRRAQQWQKENLPPNRHDFE